MTYEFIQGKRFAMQVLEDALKSQTTQFGQTSAVESALKNLERTLANKPAEYARGIMHIVGEAWKLLRNPT